VRLTVDATSVPAVSGSARDLSLLVRNLLDNAIRYTAPGGRVTASVRPDGDYVVVTISDTGVGIPSRDLDRIFERFYRVDRARSRETGGTGLGLSIVKHVVENHGGTISVDSELGRGTTFEVRLPTVTA
jgi:signal transduction histidine kinase